ncbi:hypothetical protein [Neptunicella marina]|uniref:Uncharacterized protein n=1 Tax=Neptunicella marina TaxID=2125989 RepID=A0A8J6IP10_9ALTE|nr:hypothetical protein [Neptunicella marina]MBC3764626.1 hypothetical protein [Neptunicella marina]
MMVDSKYAVRLQTKYNLYLSFLFIAALGIFYVVWDLLYSLFHVLGIEKYASGEPGESLNIFDYVYLISLVLTFLVSYLATALAVGIFNNWTVKQTLDRLVNFKNIPAHWYKQ